MVTLRPRWCGGVCCGSGGSEHRPSFEVDGGGGEVECSGVSGEASIAGAGEAVDVLEQCEQRFDGGTAGDQQRGGHPYDPIAVFGTWKAATEGAGNVGMPAMADPMPGNKWNLGSSADAVPAAAMACHEGYGAELQFEVGLVSGHSYRFQVIVHDGDQNKGGDSGEACAVFCAGTGSSWRDRMQSGASWSCPPTACPRPTRLRRLRTRRLRRRADPEGAA